MNSFNWKKPSSKYLFVILRVYEYKKQKNKNKSK